MDDILDRINQLRGVGGSLLLSRDGLIMASRLRSGADEQALAANLADTVSRSSRLCDQLGLGRPDALQIHSDQGGLALLAAGPGYLAILLDPTANLALLQLEIRPHLDVIAQQLAL